MIFASGAYRCICLPLVASGWPLDCLRPASGLPLACFRAPSGMLPGPRQASNTIETTCKIIDFRIRSLCLLLLAPGCLPMAPGLPPACSWLASGLPRACFLSPGSPKMPQEAPKPQDAPRSPRPRPEEISSCLPRLASSRKCKSQESMRKDKGAAVHAAGVFDKILNCQNCKPRQSPLSPSGDSQNCEITF